MLLRVGVERLVIFMKLSRYDKIARFKNRKLLCLRYAMKCPCGTVIESNQYNSTKAIKELEAKMKEHIETCQPYLHITDILNIGITVDQYLELLKK